MTLGEVKQRVAYIREIAGDDEMAHSDEDQLHQDVLMAVANGAAEPEALSRAALETLSIKFARWCA